MGNRFLNCTSVSILALAQRASWPCAVVIGAEVVSILALAQRASCCTILKVVKYILKTSTDSHPKFL